MTRTLWVLGMIMAVGVTAQVAQGQLITGLTRTNSENGEPQIVPEGLAVGSLVFVDRTHVYAELPQSLLGLEYGMLANNDKTDPDFQLHVTLARSATLYLFLDNRIGDNNGDNPPTLGGGVMPWVLDMGFTTTYEQIGVDEDNLGTPGRWFTVYSLQVPAGTTTLYEQNNTGSRSMYAIAVWAPSPTAYDPAPQDDAVDVPLDTMLAWAPGADAQLHDVYLGTVLADVSEAGRANPLGVLVSRGQDANTFEPLGLLEFDGVYYWRVDEVAANGTIVQGPVWQFAVEPQGYPIPGDLIVATASSSQAGFGPEKTIDGSGLDEQDGHSTAAKDMWHSEAAAEPAWLQYEFDTIYKLHQLQVWNYNGDLEYLVGFGLKEVTIEYSRDDIDWEVLGDFTFEPGTSTAGYQANTIVDFGGVAARYVRLVVNSSFISADRHGLSEVRFLYLPTWARQPSPALGQGQVDTEAVLTWRSGRDAASHEVYLDAEEQAVVAGTALAGVVGDSRCAASGLELGTTYYWKVNEVNVAEAVVSWEGPVWRFTTQDSYVVDGFESYNDNYEAGLAIWQTWLDGYESSTYGGSQVGHNPAPYAERTRVREGRQSMPFYYDNQGTYRFSEGVRTFEVSQDWTRGGTTALVLYFQGNADNTVGRLYAKLNGVPVVYEGAAEDLTKPFWIQWTIDLATVSTDLTNVETLTLGVDNGGKGLLFFDDLRLYRVAPAPAQEEVWIEAEAADSMVSPMRRYSDRPDAWGGQYIATFGDNSSGDPPDNGVASYTVRLSGGTYRIIGRVIAPTGNDDSFWVRFQGATTNTVNHASGWVQWGLEIGADWHNVPVRSADDANQTVLFTVPAGIYNVEIAFREDGALLDAWLITKQLGAPQRGIMRWGPLQ